MPLVLLTAVATGCAAEADLVLEIHRITAGSTWAVAVCDTARPAACEDEESQQHAGTVSRLGIYLDASIAPPLTVLLRAFDPVTCRLIDLDPATEPDFLVVQFPATANGDLTIPACSNCAQRSCPL